MFYKNTNTKGLLTVPIAAIDHFDLVLIDLHLHSFVHDCIVLKICTFEKESLQNTFSQINTMIDTTIPIPRNRKARNKWSKILY